MNATHLFRRPTLAAAAIACLALSGAARAEAMKVMLSGDKGGEIRGQLMPAMGGK